MRIAFHGSIVTLRPLSFEKKTFQCAPLTPVLLGNLRQCSRLRAGSRQHLGCHARHDLMVAAAGTLHGLLHNGEGRILKSVQVLEQQTCSTYATFL